MASKSEWDKSILMPPQKSPSLSRITVIYANILSLRKPLQSHVRHSKQQFLLEPFHVSYFVKYFDDKQGRDSTLVSFTGEDCVRKFLIELSRIGDSLSNELTKMNRNSVPVVINQFSNFASYFLLQNLRRTDKLSQVIMKPEDKYYSFALDIDGKHRFRFFDSKTFLKEPLDELMENFTDRQHLWRYLHLDDQQKAFIEEYSAIPLPFDFLDGGVGKLNLILEQLTTKLEAKFEDKLSSKDPKKEYEKAKKIWTMFRCQDLKEYVELHGKFQVLSLCDIFEKLRDLCENQYNLEMLDFKTPATLTWQAMLNYIDVGVELLSDFDMIKFVKNNKRGGISQCCKRHAKANNEFLESTYKAKDPSTFIIYLDMNNASGYAMSQYLPIGDYTWDENVDDYNKEAILAIPEKGEYGYIMEVDLHYPRHYHEAHKDLPYCCEKEKRGEADEPRLITNLNCKKNYVIHYRNLQQCLSCASCGCCGLDLMKVHKVLKFRQSPWLAGYVENNTKLRAEAAKAENDLETKFYKLMNNSLSGMTKQNVDEQLDLSVEEFGPPNVLTTENCDLINQHCYLRKSERKTIRYTELVHVHFCISELIKLRMYDFHYKYMSEQCRKSKKKLNLLYMETDSLFYEIETKNFYEEFMNCTELRNEFDTSETDPRWSIEPNNTKVVGKFKDEKDGRLIKEFYGTGSKTFYYRCEPKANEEVSEEVVKRWQGIPKYHIERSISMEDYVRRVDGNEKVKINYWTVEKEGFNLIITRGEKTYSPGDAKRKVVERRETVPYGYKSDYCCKCISVSDW